ncbi:hypothetical protein QTO34_012826 [Cnephaeus nilssonii]|uniref:Uncharacterized protein n=1 Tax=Cnephaeus nilssonii TaxID=3371016 RepID=A0AA40HBJ9_CNENI|nr:hypothetical protein QTO34_012826 [Eptesicus nilssonii]
MEDEPRPAPVLTAASRPTVPFKASTSASRYLSLPKNTKLPEKLQKKRNVPNAGVQDPGSGGPRSPGPQF